MYSRVTIFLILFAFTATANINQNTLAGDQIFTHNSPYSHNDDYCAITAKTSIATYSAKDLKVEKKLCNMNFYSNKDSNQTYAVCPKMRSTNPGLEVYQLKFKTKNEFEQTECYKRKPKAKKIAKFKQGLTCSYTPSIIGYYHLSRILEAADVPVSVTKLMDVNGHKKYVDNAKRIAEYRVKNGSMNSGSVIYKAWTSSWIRAHQNLGKKIRGGVTIIPERVFTDDLQHVYGALSVNPRNEFKYKEVYGRFRYDTRYETFMKQKPYLKLTRSKPIHHYIERNLQSAANEITQMKDVSDMIVMDYIMSQQDRIGNIHFYYHWVQEINGELVLSKATIDDNDNVDATEKSNMTANGAVLIKKMILKDNDCGVIKSNMMIAKGVLNKVKHLSLSTYNKLLTFHDFINTIEGENYIKENWLFSDKDFYKVKTNTNKLMSTLYDKCKQGALHLDLDLQPFLNAQEPIDSRALCKL